MRQVLRAGALGCPRGMGWGGRREGGLGWGTHVNPWLIHVNVWQKPLQYYKVISLQLIKINGKKKKTFLVDLTCQPKDTQPPAIASFSSLKQFYGLSKSSLNRWAIVYLHSLCFPFALQVIIPANTFFSSSFISWYLSSLSATIILLILTKLSHLCQAYIRLTTSNSYGHHDIKWDSIPGGSHNKESTCNAGDSASIPG